MKKILFSCIVLFMVSACSKNESKSSESNNLLSTDTTKCQSNDSLIIPSAITDVDGNTYAAVKIGEQVWMAENMRATKDYSGNEIILCDDLSYYKACLYYPDNNSENVKDYGYLYNWKAAMKICPLGWHLPTEEEWVDLKYNVRNSFVCTSDNDMREALASMGRWIVEEDSESKNENKAIRVSETGFSALPAGQYCLCNGFDSVTRIHHYSTVTQAPIDFYGFGTQAYFWSASEDGLGMALSFGITLNDVKISPLSENTAISVRCVRD